MKQRVITAVFGIAIVLAIIVSSMLAPLIGLAGVLVAIAGWEADKLLGTRGASVVATLLFLLPTLSFTKTLPLDLPVGSLCAAWVLSVVALYTCRWFVWRILAASGWIALPLALVVWLQIHGNAGWKSPLLWLLVTIWTGDSAALFVGKAWGKRLLMPAVSPKKTVEGSLANLIFSVVVSILVGNFIGLPGILSLAGGLAISIMGQLGDLYESQLKRRADMKDSGQILPGHGGVLDRIDSLLFAAVPAGVLYFVLVMPSR
ncbi:MAG: phosphatidate cytidylyltransferase [Armatimonadetes bacterium]|nr:phosphatidate cytidylyltransferase [Armatimonadota bacterium]